MQDVEEPARAPGLTGNLFVGAKPPKGVRMVTSAGEKARLAGLVTGQLLIVVRLLSAIPVNRLLVRQGG